MTIAELAREMFDVHHDMRAQLGALRLEAALPAVDLAGQVAASVAKLNALVARADQAVEAFVAATAD